MKRVALLAIVVGLGLSVVAGDLLAAVTLTTLHTFTGADGDAPVAGLALGTNGNFYGTTEFGGMETNGCVGSCGTLFEISSDGAFTSLHLFNYDDGSAPRGGLVQASDGNLYGTTFDGGACGLGTAFRITASGVLTTISPPDPGSCCAIGSNAKLVQTSDGNLYGTGGAGVFQIATNGVCTALNVELPESTPAGLIQGSDGNLYGTTQFGGTSSNCSSGCGTVFKMTTNGVLTILHSFDGSDGQQPLGDLVEGNDGNFYGTTSGSVLGALNCTNGCGTVFQITPDGVFTNLHAFTGPEGKLPKAGLALGSDSNFYGTASSGGAFGVGTVFQITTNGDLTKLVSFNALNGGDPVARLLLGPDGAFYGTTEVGGSGTNALGTVFKLTISTNSSVTISCVLSPALATNTVNTPNTVVATVTSNGVAKSGLHVNFSVLGANAGQTGSATTSAGGLGTFTYTGTIAGTDAIRAIAGGATGTATKVWIAAVATHDLEVTKLKAPKKITLSATKPNITGKFAVTIQNNGDATEVIPDLGTLANLVTLNIQSLGACTNPVAMLTTPKFVFPFQLAPKKKLNLAYTTIFSCANNPLATTKTATNNDYQTTAVVDLSALSETDSTSSNDLCPRPPSGSDPGCGNKTLAGTLGGDVLIDVVVK
ncbi:MAG TPA: choice-of-anchor tandem repeat GloVer-containing protein [Verrucomicrobiae bacterium]|nr:choice-of-anchor tandem repeat GloVer-containing protein [Verrucomicrobiae bacterium]